MKNILPDITEIYLQKRQEGMSFSQIREELHKTGYNERDIKEIIRNIDNLEFAGFKKKNNKNLANEKIYAGLILMIVSAVLLMVLVSIMSGIITYLLMLFCVAAFSVGNKLFIAGKALKNK